MPESLLESGLLVQRGQEPRKHYELAHLLFEAEPHPFSVNFIPIALIERQLLVAAPKAVWNKAVGERLLPKGALSRAVLVDVLVASTDLPEEQLEDHPGIKVWVGFLQARWRNRLVLGGAENVTFDVWLEDDVFSLEPITVMPFGPALAQLADEHFSFLSALSAAAEEAGGVENRLGKLEETFQLIQAQLQSLVEGGPRTPFVGARPKAAGRRAEARNSGGGKFDGLDPAVVASAQEAGISEEQLKEVASLVRKDTKLADLPHTRAKRKNVLSETEDEDEEELLEEVEGEGGDASQPMEKAIVKLTKIVGSLARKKGSGLEAMLDSLDGGEGASSSSSSRSKAAAFKKLKGSLLDSPKFLYETIEELMDQDFAQVKAGPGLASVATSSRAWLEHRSRLQNYPNTVRMAWQIASIHDALSRDAYSEARARSALLLTALDQAAIDAGNWTLAQEILLEPPAPFAAFAAKRAPEPWEQSTSRLLDDRWLDILMWKIKDRDAYLEARKRLAGNRSAPGPPKPDNQIADLKDAAPKRAAKGAKDGKGKHSSKAGGAAEETQG